MATSNMVFLYAYGTKGSAGPLRMGSGKDGFFRAGTTDIIKVWIQNFWNIHRMLVNIGNRTSFIDSYTDKFKFELDIGQICVSVPVFFNISSVFDCYYRNTICSLIRLYERFLVLVLYNFCV